MCTHVCIDVCAHTCARAWLKKHTYSKNAFSTSSMSCGYKFKLTVILFKVLCCEAVAELVNVTSRATLSL